MNPIFSPTHPLEAIIFDLDFTLANPKLLGDDTLGEIKRLLTDWGAMTQAEIKKVESALWRQPPLDVFAQITRLPGDILATLVDAYNRMPICDQYRPYDDVVPFLEAMKSSEECPFMALVTKGLSGYQTRKIQALGIEHYFDIVQVVGDPRWSTFQDKTATFGWIAQHHSLRNPNIAVIGDNANDELAAARRHSMLPIQTVRPGVTPDQKSARRIESLDELWGICSLKAPVAA